MRCPLRWNGDGRSASQNMETVRRPLGMRFPVAITFTDILPVAIVAAVESIQHKGICPYSAHLFINVLAKVGNVEDAASIV